MSARNRPTMVVALCSLCVFLCLLGVACGDEEEDTRPDEELIVGTWTIETSVDKNVATYNVDGSFTVQVETTQGGAFAPQLGTWSLGEAHSLVRTLSEGAGRNTDTFYVSPSELVVGGTWSRLSGKGENGRYQSLTVIEVASGGDLVLSSRLTKTLELNGDGTGSLNTRTERGDTSPVEEDVRVLYEHEGSSLKFVSGVNGTFSFRGDRMVNLTNVYRR